MFVTVKIHGGLRELEGVRFRYANKKQECNFYE